MFKTKESKLFYTIGIAIIVICISFLIGYTHYLNKTHSDTQVKTIIVDK